MDSNLINKIAIQAGAEVSPPTLPSLGSNVADWTGWDTFGSKQQFSDNHDLEADSVSVERERVVEEIRAARALAPEDLVLISQRINEFTFNVKSVAESLLALDSALKQSNNETELDTSLSFFTAVVELNGLALDYYPKVALFVNNWDAGYGEDGTAVTEVAALPLATTAIPGGFKRMHYTA